MRRTRPAAPSDTLGPSLRILAFTDYLSAHSCGGAERVTREVYARLTAQAEVCVLTATPHEQPGEGQIDEIRVIRVAAWNLSRLVGAQACMAPSLAVQALRLVHAFRPDVLHANGLHFQTSVAAAICQASTGIPLVTTAHIGGPQALRTRVRLATGAYERTVGRAILARTRRVIAVSTSVGHHLQTLGVPASRITVVPNGVDLARFSPRPLAGRNATEPVTPVAVFIGRLIQNKGPDTFIDALEILRAAGEPWRGVIVGEGPLRPALERRVAASGLWSLISFTGACADVAPWLRQATCLVRPSLTEGMPLTVLEAMAMGTPVVASAIPGNTDLVEHEMTGLLFPPGNAAGLAAQLSRCARDELLVRRLVAAGRQQAEAHSWDTCAAATLAVLAAARAPGALAGSP